MQPVLAALLAACGDDPPGRAEPPDEVLDPGARPLSRLNATEYDATVRDLLGTSRQPGRTFPADESAYGFDNIASVLTTTSNHVEGWEVAAGDLLDEMFGLKSEITERYGTQAEAPGVTYTGEGMPLGSDAYAVFSGGLSAPFALSYDGRFEVAVAAFGRPLGGASPVMEVRIDGQLAGSFIVDNEIGQTEEFVLEVDLDDGLHSFEILLANPYEAETQRRSLIIDYLRIDGPTDPQIGRTAAYDQFVSCAPDGEPDRRCAEQAIAGFGRMAWRRALDAEEVDWALSLYDRGLGAELPRDEALRFAFQGILLSPEFLYRIERDPDPGSDVRLLDGYEVATRLAAFAWSSAPSDGLLVAAELGDLGTAQGLEAALDELLADDRSEALVDNLAGQWFAIRALETATADVTLYPEFDDALRASMQGELRRQMHAFFRDGVPLDATLTAQTTWIDARLAEHYGLPYDGGGDWVQTSLAGTGRVGLFGSAGWLMAGSRADGPSAVRRGKWIVGNLLCSPPPPPPPSVESMVQIAEGGGSVRQQEEAQRSDAYCQGCHAAMDPLGFALWGYDAVGAERTTDELGFPVDTETTLAGPEGDIVLSGPEDLAAWVLADPRLPRCVAEKTLTYALGRAMRPEDAELIDRVSEAFVAGGQTFDALARAIVTSDAFRFRGAPEVP